MRRSLLKSKKLKNLIPKKILEGLIFESIVGSRLNETHDDKNSDFDIIGISLIKDINDALPYYKNLDFLYHFDKIDPFNFLNISVNIEKIEYDIKIYSFSKFLKLLKNNNPNIIELLFIPDNKILYKNIKIWDNIILKNKSEFISKSLVRSILKLVEQKLKELISLNHTDIGKKTFNIESQIKKDSIYKNESGELKNLESIMKFFEKNFIIEYKFQNNTIQYSEIKNISYKKLIKYPDSLKVNLRFNIENDINKTAKIAVEYFNGDFLKIENYIRNIIIMLHLPKKMVKKQKNIRKFGYNPKSLYYIIMLMNQANNIINKNKIIYNYDNNYIKQMKFIKKGGIKYNELNHHLTQIKKDLDNMFYRCECSSIRKNIDNEKIKSIYIESIKQLFNIDIK